jgi:hypothetical protein
MAGLLDVLQGLSNNPQLQTGLLATGLGMLANNQGGASTGQVIGRGGLLGMNAYAQAGQTAREAQQDKLKAAMMAQQMQQVDAETQMKQQQLAQAMRAEQMRQGILGQVFPGLAGDQGAPAAAGPMAAPQMAPNAGGSALSGALAGAAPMNAPQGGQGAQGGMGGGQMGGMGGGPLAGLSETQRARMGLDIAFNGGKNLADIAKPDMSIQNGIVVDMNKMQAGQTLPTTTPDGQAIQWQPVGNGQYKLTIPQGAVDVQRVNQQIKNEGELQPVLDDNGNTVLVRKSDAPGMKTSLNPARQSYLTKVADSDADALKGMDTAADAARSQVSQYQQLGAALKAFNDNGSSSAMAAAQEKMKSVLPGYKGGQAMEYGQLIDNLGSQMTADMRSQMGMQRLTDADLKYLNTLVVGKDTSPVAAQQIIDARVRTLQRTQEVRDMASQWEAKYGQLSARNPAGLRFQDALSRWSDQNPLFPQAQQGQ